MKQLTDILNITRDNLSDRPNSLLPLFSKTSSIKGIGLSGERRLQKIGINCPRDLILHIPVKYIYRKPVLDFGEINCPDNIIVKVEVLKYFLSGSFGPSRVLVKAKNFNFFITFFKTSRSLIIDSLPIGHTVLVSGKLEFFGKELQMVHPEYLLKPEKRHEIRMFDPSYPLSSGLNNKYIGKCIQKSLLLVGKVDDWLEDSFLKNNEWPNFNEAIEIIHGNSPKVTASSIANARKRLIFDEFFAHKISQELVKFFRKKNNGLSRSFDGSLSKGLIHSLEFFLTTGQISAIEEINQDLASSYQMCRLLQGDVGSGKTIVALVTVLNAIERGGQAAILAPTEILSIQHHRTVKNLLENLGLEICMFTGSDRGELRLEKLKKISDGSCRIIIGTHALFQDDIKFNKLNYVVIDEQHRFGVSQRNEMLNKGKRVDLLMMSATPIPRSLSMVKYGDLDLSVLNTKPDGRTPIATAVISKKKLLELIERLKIALKSSQAYWICPLIEETEKIDLIAAESRFSYLANRLKGFKLGLLHGKMSSAEKEMVMHRFSSNEIDLLISTTVIEVGVDVPNASIMIVEGAERFGLAQLHQIRGRVGRGKKESSCTLIHSQNLSPIAVERLNKLRICEDGFEIAEFDLMLRGEGEIIGFKQSGIPEFRIARPGHDIELLQLAKEEVEKLNENDLLLASSLGQKIKYLLNFLGKINFLERI